MKPNDAHANTQHRVLDKRSDKRPTFNRRELGECDRFFGYGGQLSNAADQKPAICNTTTAAVLCCFFFFRKPNADVKPLRRGQHEPKAVQGEEEDDRLGLGMGNEEM